MKESATIKIDLLPDGARKEIVDFYEYLLNKYSRKNDAVKNSEMKKKSGARTVRTFLSRTEKLSFDLPRDYCFDRDSLHDR
jgi:hypothetical protein